jgi:hypothetical protein
MNAIKSGAQKGVAQSRILTLRHFPGSAMRQGCAWPQAADSLKNTSLRYRLTRPGEIVLAPGHFVS